MPEFHSGIQLEVVPRGVVPTLLVVCYYQLLLLLLLPCACFMLNWIDFPVLFTAQEGEARGVGVSNSGWRRGVIASVGVGTNLHCFSVNVQVWPPCAPVQS